MPLDQYALLRRAIREDDERDSKAAKLLRDRARAKREREAASQYRTPEWCTDAQAKVIKAESIGAIMAEADWEAEIYLINVELFMFEETLP